MPSPIAGTTLYASKCTKVARSLPTSDSGRYYNEEQIETRVFAIKHAYKAAKSLVREIVTR